MGWGRRQIPNPKLQIPTHAQIPNPKPTLNPIPNWELVWDLEVGSALGFGAWSLGFDVIPRPMNPFPPDPTSVYS